MRYTPIKVVAIVGARPQFIKAAVVSRELKYIKGFSEILIHTGQHYDDNLSAVFFKELSIPKPDYNLEVGSAFHGSQTGQMLKKIEEILLELKPSYVLVYGDTNSTLAGALAAAKLHIPVAHVEAGLRSFNRIMPEEINRVLTDHCAEILFAPTEVAVNNLKREGFPSDRIEMVGDVMLDAALYYGVKAENASKILERRKLKHGEYILATVHRAENTDNLNRLQAIMEGLSLVAREIPVVMPLHPRTCFALERAGMLGWLSSGITVLSPLGYLDMLMLEKNALLIATDSGGVQKEAYFYQVPCVTLRDETEWTELVNTGWNRLCSPKSGKIINEIIMNQIGRYGVSVDLYGKGDAAKKIVDSISCRFSRMI